MPIYKVTSPQRVVSLKFTGSDLSSSASSNAALRHDKYGDEYRVEYNGEGMQNKNIDVEYEVSSYRGDNGLEKNSDRQSTKIEQEIREQLRREAELAAVRGSILNQPSKFTSFSGSTVTHHRGPAEDEEIRKSGFGENGRWVSEDVFQPRGRHSPVEERKLVVITSPEVTGSSTTTYKVTTSASFSPTRAKETRHGGSGLILKELNWQKEREEELRMRRKEAGVSFESDIEDGRLELYSPRPYDEHRDLVDFGEVRMERPDEDRHKISSPDAGVRVQEHKETKRNTMSDDVTKYLSNLPGPSQKQLPKVQPFEDVEQIQSEVCVQYVPQVETPIEREIRLAREKEDALRMARGMVAVVMEHSSDREVEVKILKPRISEAGPHHSSSVDISMKKFAECRLRTELEREKRREIDLRKEGKIVLLSEERTPDVERQVQPLSLETQELREFSKRRATHHSDHPDGTDRKWGGNGEVGAYHVTYSSSSSAQKHSPHDDDADVREHRTSLRTGWSTTSGDDVRRSVIGSTERRIENEIAESKKREQELKELRKNLLLRSTSSTDSHVTSPGSPEVKRIDGKTEVWANAPRKDSPDLLTSDMRYELTVVTNDDHADDQHESPPDSPEVRREPRRLTLIDQWERGLFQRTGIAT